ncbi:MAG: TRAP transporter small permease [Lawsonibacter sp.]|nr:TRAP transporter small permease [Lawsonibacter sp.]
MKLFRKITDAIAKISEIVCMVMISALVLLIVTELFRRNFLNQSYRGTIELCGICFLWMAFIGIIPLYHDSGLMRLDFLVSKAKGPIGEAIYFVNKAFSLMLGIVMIIAFTAQLEFVGTRYYSTFTLKIPYTIQYIPMAFAGAYIALTSVQHILERILELSGKQPKEA